MKSAMNKISEVAKRWVECKHPDRETLNLAQNRSLDYCYGCGTILLSVDGALREWAIPRIRRDLRDELKSEISIPLGPIDGESRPHHSHPRPVPGIEHLSRSDRGMVVSVSMMRWEAFFKNAVSRLLYDGSLESPADLVKTASRVATLAVDEQYRVEVEMSKDARVDLMSPRSPIPPEEAE
jgi:hypothetical protein